MIERFHDIQGLDRLEEEVWRPWLTWFVDVEESHTSLTALPFSRSPQPDRSWITAAGVVLDGASLSDHGRLPHGAVRPVVVGPFSHQDPELPPPRQAPTAMTGIVPAMVASSLTTAARGPVALVGSGEFKPVMEEVDAELLAGRPPRAVFLPTAAGEEGAGRVDYWVRLGMEHYRRLGVEPVPLLVLDRSSADDPSLAAEVAGAGLVYLSGGNPGYLAATLAGTAVLDAILGAWAGGAALAGCSAGACALTAVADDVRAGRRQAGLGVIGHLVVLPHFDRIERWWTGVVERRLTELAPGQVLIGIDEETALVGGPDRWRVLGRRRVWVFDESGERHGHEAGTELELALPSTTAVPSPSPSP